MNQLIWILIVILHMGGGMQIHMTGYADSDDCVAAMQQISTLITKGDVAACVKSELVGKST